MRQLADKDLVGLGWRPELGPAIFSHLDQIEVVEVIIDDYFSASAKELRALQTLGSQVPALYHGVCLGLASAWPVDEQRLSQLARVLNVLKPEIWSEHLAFVRAGGYEVGHLAAPPRTLATIDGTLKNLRRIRSVVGSVPCLENIATLLDPPGSKMDEPEWVTCILSESSCQGLLDLHNLYANAVNFGQDPILFLEKFPLHLVRLVHLSGGKWIQEPHGQAMNGTGMRLLDDHIHDVPDVVFDLLAVVAEKVPQNLTVIIERDGAYPDFSCLLDQVQRAKEILKNARDRQSLLRIIA